MELNKHVVFMVGQDEDGKTPLVVLGLTREAWEYMRDGKTHTFDLTKVGINAKLLLFGAEDHAQAMGMLKTGAESKGIEIIDARGEDFSV